MYTHPLLFIAKSSIPEAGDGVFAKQRLKKGSKLGYYIGNVQYKDDLLESRDYVLTVTKRPPWLPPMLWKEDQTLIDGLCLLAYVNDCRHKKRRWECRRIS